MLNRILIEDTALAVFFVAVYYGLLAVLTGGHPTQAGHLFPLGYLVAAWLLVMDFGWQLRKAP